MTKKKALLIGIGLVFIAAIIVSVNLVFCASKYGNGVVTRISLTQKREDTMLLQMNYLLPSGNYSVRAVPEGEGEYIGDGMIDYNGAIGKYRIMIHFGDVELAESFAKKMDENGIFMLADGVWAKTAAPSDHGFVLYIGSDKPLGVEPVEHGTLNALAGTIKISIAEGNESTLT
ncbi:MAG: hypothetical protein IJW50_03535 [Clostridia bacterium]|nr:hypothetical protein [Clostridia bacterium]